MPSAGSQFPLPDPADLELYRWLTSPAAEPWLAEALASDEDGPRLATRLRRGLAPGQVRLVLDQAGLRRKARAKFPAAARMFFAATPLEQATDAAVADYKAARFPREVPVLDACTGIGGDLLALARRGPATGLERHAVLAELARANLRAVLEGERAARSQVALGELAADAASRGLLAQAEAWHVDPDRRATGRRTSRVEASEPSLDTLDALRAVHPHLAVKLAPAAEVPLAWQREAEWEWISHHRECRQLVAWFGRLTAEPGVRRATRLGAEGRAATFAGQPGRELSLVEGPSEFLIEPDAALLAANLTGAWAEAHGLAALEPRHGYLTGNQGTGLGELAAVFRVLDVMPFDRRRLAEWLRGRGIGRLEIKKRGVEIDPARLARELAGSGERACTLVLARTPARVLAILAERVSRDEELGPTYGSEPSSATESAGAGD